MTNQAVYGISKNARAEPKVKWLLEKIQEGDSDLAIAIGGDGEAFAAFHNYPDKKLLHLRLDQSAGFYSAMRLKDVDDRTIERIAKDDYRILELPLLKVGLDDGFLRVLNDASLVREPNGKSGKFNIDIDGDSLKQSADGVIVCTPSGSSAHSFSANGPLISWGLPAYGVTIQAATRGLRSFSYVVPGDKITQVTSDYECFLEYDGASIPLPAGSSVSFCLAGRKAKIVQLDRESQLQKFTRIMLP